MKTYSPSHLRAQTRPDRGGSNRTARRALECGVLGLSVLMVAALLIRSSTAKAQAGGPAGNVQAVGTMSDVMVSMVYPAANSILLSLYRGGPQDDKEWMALQRSAVLLAESGSVLMRRGPGGGEGEWAKDAKMLVDVGAAAYKAARAKDGNALVALNQPLNAACTDCHKQYRANVAGPRERVGPSRQPAE
jgi:hypothetical protein